MSNKMYLHKSVSLHKHSKRCFSPTQTELCFYILLTHAYIIYMYTYYKHRDVYITVLVQFCFPQRKQLLYLMSNTITRIVVISYESRQDKEFLSLNSSPALRGDGGSWGCGSRQCFQHPLCAPAWAAIAVGCQHVPPHVIFPSDLHQFHIYLLVLTFTIKKQGTSKETASQDRLCSPPIGTVRAHRCR